MPHSSRPKRPSHQKRQQVAGDDGWTHVTNTRNAGRVDRSIKHQRSESGEPSQGLGTGLEPVLGPAEAPAKLTLSDLEMQYQRYLKNWLESDSWSSLGKDFNAHVIRTANGTKNDQAQTGSGRVQNVETVDRIVCIGLGSPSGFMREGWVDRRDVSMYQLAALESIKNHLSGSAPLTVYAQDPVFNNLDRGLLESLGITVVDHPEAFGLITRSTLLFCPGAEKKHLELVLPSNPLVLFGGPLENTNSNMIQSFVDSRESRSLKEFSRNEHAFWKTRLYFRVEDDK